MHAITVNMCANVFSKSKLKNEANQLFIDINASFVNYFFSPVLLCLVVVVGAF